MSYFEDSDNDDNSSIKSSELDNDSEPEIIKRGLTKKLIENDVIESEDDENESIMDMEEEDEDEDEDEVDNVVKGAEGTQNGGKTYNGVDFDSDDEDNDMDGSDEENDDGEDIKPVERKKKITITSNVGKKGQIPSINDINLSDDEEDEADEDGELYLKKFDKDINDNYLLNYHPECALHNYDEVLAMSKVIRDKNGIIIDDLHKTIPYLTKYERARILGQRAKQINSGATAFVKVPENVIDGYLIAELELKEKRIPFIIRRPLPNGGSEYWSVKDLENIIF